MVNKIKTIRSRLLNFLNKKSRIIFICSILIIAFFGISCAITALILSYGFTIGTILNVILAIGGILLITKLVIQWRKILFKDM